MQQRTPEKTSKLSNDKLKTQTKSPGNKMKKWTIEEDSLLEKYQKRFGNKWNKIASLIPHRTASQCSQRFRRKFKPDRVHKPWSESEDQTLRALVRKLGKNWQTISCIMKTRTAKQIRERFINILDSNVSKFKWTEKEDLTLEKAYREFGAKWAQISKLLPGRPENSVKNRFHSHLKKKMFGKIEEKRSFDFEETEKKLSFAQQLNEKTEKTENFEKERNEPALIKFENEVVNLTESIQSMTSSARDKSEFHSLLPQDVLKLKVKASNSSEISVKLKKSCSSESENMGLIPIGIRGK